MSYRDCEGWANYATSRTYNDMLREYVNTLHEEVVNENIEIFENVEELAGTLSDYVYEMMFLDGRDKSLAHDYALEFTDGVDYLEIADHAARNCEGLVAP